PASNASDKGKTCSRFCARTTAITPGFVSSEMISALARIVSNLLGAIRFGKQRDGMNNAQRIAVPFRATDDLQETTGIASSHHTRSRGLDVHEFSFQKLIGHFGLSDVVYTRAAAAPRTFMQLDKFQIGNRFKQVTRLVRNFLSVTQVAGFMICHHHLLCRSRRKEALTL